MTADVAGPAPTVVNTTMLGHLQLSADKVRPSTPDSIKPACPFFVTSKVKPVWVAQDLGRHWFLVTGVRRIVTPTLIRKTIATKVIYPKDYLLN